MCVAYGGRATNISVRNHGYIRIAVDGTASRTLVSSGGSLCAIEGSSYMADVFEYGKVYISSGGITDVTNFNGGGEMYLTNGYALCKKRRSQQGRAA